MGVFGTKMMLEDQGINHEFPGENEEDNNKIVDQFAILWYVAVVITRLNEIKAKIKTLNENLLKETSVLRLSD